METLSEILNTAEKVFNYPLFQLKDNTITTGTIISSLFFIFMLLFVAARVARVLKSKVLPRYKVDVELADAIGNLFKYGLIVLGLIIIFSSAGIDLSAFTVLLGTLGIGIGFGLQNIINNFVSGVALLVERPIRVGDRIEVGNTSGDVIKIGPRATTVLTNDNIAIIVPNSDFITKEVINWSFNESVVRIKIPVGVAYSSDVRVVEKLLLEVAAKNADVLKEPASVVRFMELGDNAILFELRIWTTTHVRQPGKIKSDLYFSIFDTFKENKVEIPFPQRVVHLKQTQGNPI